MAEDFSKYPELLNERRAVDKKDAQLWAPRDVLLSLLKDIDNGAEVTGIIVLTRFKDTIGPGYSIAGLSRLEAAGLLMLGTKEIVG